MKTKTYKNKTALLNSSRGLSYAFIIGIMSLLFSYQANAQKLANDFSFEVNTSVMYDQSTASATIEFIWKEDNGTCKTANTLRWLDLYMLDPNGVIIPYKNGPRVMTIIKRKKPNSLMFNDCDGIGQYFSYGCNHMDHCFLASNGAASDTFVDDVSGTGNTQKIRIVLKNLPNETFGQELTFRFYGWVDYEGVSGDEDNGRYRPDGRGFPFDFNKKASGGVMQGISNPNLSISQGDCSDAVLNWNAVTGPNNAGTVKYWIYKNDAFVTSTTNTTYTDPDRFLPGEQADYSIRTIWTPAGVTERQAITEPSNPVQFTAAMYDGKITVTAQTETNIPLPGQKVDMVFDGQDNSPECNFDPTAEYNRSGETNEFGKFEFNNLWYGHPDDDPSSWYVRLLDSDNNVIAQELVSLDNGNGNNIKTVTLVDPDAYIINGKVTTEMTCGLDEAIISAELVGPANIPVTEVETENDGTYSLVIPGPGTYDVTVTKKTNQDEDGEMHQNTERIVATNRITDNADIEYTHDNELHGFVGGDCNAYWGGAIVKAYSAATQCFLKQTTTDANGEYSFDVPAHDIILQVDDFNPTSGPRANEGVLQPIDYEVALDSTTNIDFIFRTPISISVTGWPAIPCEDVPYPILDQYTQYTLSFLVQQGDGCLVDEGFVYIQDDIGGYNDEDGLPVVVFDTIPIINGVAEYKLIPRLPNILGDFSKEISFIAGAGPDVLEPEIVSAPLFERAIIVGSAPRGTQFTTASPEIPKIILRDPPGDLSYSYIGIDSSYSFVESNYTQKAFGGSAWVKATAGVEIEIISFEAFASAQLTLGGEKNKINSTESLYEFTTTTEYSTSDDPSVAGQSGDVYIGNAYNIIYANSDIVFFDLAGCNVDKRVDLVVDTHPFPTGFAYAEQNIINSIIPALQDIVDDQTQDEKLRHLSQESISVWHQVIDMNADLKEEAFNNPSPNNGSTNQSIGGAAGPFQKNFTETTSETRTVEWNTIINEDIAIEAGFSLSGSGVEGGTEINFRQEFGGSRNTNVTTSVQTGFVLDDDDNGDLFTVDWAMDPVFGTPVFRVPSGAGETSCPYELGAERTKGAFTINSPIQNVPAGTNVALFDFVLGNVSETEEENDYIIELVSAPGGISIDINGPPTNSTWTESEIDYNTERHLDAFFTRNQASPRFDFEGLVFKAYPACDEDRAIYRTVSVFFESPCSDILLSSPSDGFVINETSDNQLEVAISDYDYNSNITKVKLEYGISVDGEPATNFTTSNINLNKNDLVNNQPPRTFRTWDTEGLPDGEYSIRLRLESGACISFSPRVIGIIDNTDASIFGEPYPADDDIVSGDIIGATFDEELDCTANMTVNVIMMPDNVSIPATITCNSVDIEIIPVFDLSTELGKTFIVTLEGVTDIYGNITDPLEWEFRVGNIDSDGDGLNDGDEACLGAALNFESGDAVRIPHHQDFNLIDGDFSFQAWINPSGSGYRSIINRFHDPLDGNMYDFYLLNNNMYLSLSDDVDFVQNNSSIPNNEWTHVGVSVDLTNTSAVVVTFFVNGVIDAERTITTAVPSGFTSNNFNIRISEIGRRMNGRIDDFSIWDKQLSAAEVTATMAGQLNGTENGLVAYYDFNDGDICANNAGQTTLIDAANSHNGALLGFSLNGCGSNWGSERGTDSDDDGILDICDQVEECLFNSSSDIDGDLVLDCLDLCPNFSDTALDFDSDGSNKVSINDANGSVSSFGNSNFTIEAWVNPDGEVYTSILSNPNVKFFLNFLVFPEVETVFNKPQRLVLILDENGSANTDSQVGFSNSIIPSGRWTHVAVSFDQVTREATFFVNGVEDGTHIFTDFKGFTQGLSYEMGSFVFTTGGFSIDDFTIWTRTLNETEIQATMAGAITGNETNLVLHYDFNEGIACGGNSAINQVIDVGPNGNNGTLSGFSKSSCGSNWITGRNTDSDNDGIGDACDVLDACIPNYANSNKITGATSTSAVYETDGVIESVQRIAPPASVIYTSAVEINLEDNFEVEPGVAFHAFIFGCAGLEYDLQTLLNNGFVPADLISSGYSSLELIGLNYQGGIVFEVNPDGSGLVAAPADLGNLTWGCMGTAISGADGVEIGDGYQNTLDIIADCPTSPAALACANYSGGGFTDWYLPSLDEVSLMRDRIGPLAQFPNTNIGNFPASFYHTSSELDQDKSLVVNFSIFSDDDSIKTVPFGVRAIRSF